MIISDQSLPAVGVRTDHANGLPRRSMERQDAVVFQKHNRLSRELLCHLQMRLALHFFVGNVVVFAAVKQAEQIPRGEGAHRRLRDLLLRHQPLFQGFQQIEISHAAVDVAAAL